jgi:NAD(P)H-dependent flavin oxidoreductase YrpB (nitropropane dioxygenase family)
VAVVPRVVDAVAPVPVAAAGGIADGRSLAAAIVLGASGANIGTRFLASHEAEIGAEWKRAIVEARSEDAVKAEFAPDILPPADEVPFSGQTVGMIDDVLPAGEIVRSLVEGAERALARAG